MTASAFADTFTPSAFPARVATNKHKLRPSAMSNHGEDLLLLDAAGLYPGLTGAVSYGVRFPRRVKQVPVAARSNCKVSRARVGGSV
jgi:hypothetical protein